MITCWYECVGTYIACFVSSIVGCQFLSPIIPSFSLEICVGLCGRIYGFYIEEIGNEYTRSIWIIISCCYTINKVLSSFVAQCPIITVSCQLSPWEVSRRIWHFRENKITYQLCDRAVHCLHAMTQWTRDYITVWGQSAALCGNCKQPDFILKTAITHTWQPWYSYPLCICMS